MRKMINRYLFVFIVTVPLGSVPVNAHGPARVLLVEEIAVNAAPQKIWDIIADFCSIKDWHPEVTHCQNDQGNEPGSSRTITLESGEQIKEILAKYRPEVFMLQHYMAENQELKTYPIATHGLTITITDDGQGGSNVKWKGAFYRSFPGPNPPHELSDEFATEKLTGFYRSGLENIKKLSE